MPSSPYARMKIWMDFFTFRTFLRFSDFLDGLETLRIEFVDNLKQYVQEMDEEGPSFMGKGLFLVDLNTALVLLVYSVRSLQRRTLRWKLQTGEWARRCNMEEIPKVAWFYRSSTKYQKHYLPYLCAVCEECSGSEMAKALREDRGIPRMSCYLRYWKWAEWYLGILYQG